MKKVINYLHLYRAFFCYLMMLTLVMGLVSCSDENQPARTPVSSFSVSQKNLEINQSMKIDFTGVADQIVVYTGDEGHKFSLRDSSNTGFVVNKGRFTYSYSVPGTFHVVVMASTYNTILGDGLRTDTTSFDVIVKDDVTKIDQAYTNITPNIYYVDFVDEGNMLLCLPTKQVYNSREIPLNAAKQRLKFDIASDSSKIYVDNALWTGKDYYNLTQTHNIRVVSHSGSIRNYKLYCLIYPEFSSISINGVKGKVIRDAFNQNIITYQFALPAGFDIHNLVVDFALDGEGQFFIGTSTVSSGQTVDLSKGTSFTIVRTHPENSKVKATTIINFEFI